MYIKKHFSKSRILATTILTALVYVSLTGMSTAQTVLQAYKSDQPLQSGMLVALTDDQTKAEPITQDNLDQLKGVVVNQSDSPVTLKSDDQQTFVATSGKRQVLLSNENGSIKKGDYISISSLSGIGMRATVNQPIILGRAVQDFNGGGDSIGKSVANNNKQVSFGRIQVDVNIGKNPALKTPEKDKVPDLLQKAANTVAQKPVATTRIYLALVVLLATTGIVMVTMFSGARSTVTAIGRNPLSKGLIFKGLLQVTLVSLIIFIAGLFGVYLLIKL